MKLFKKISTSLSALALMVTMLAAGSGSASAACLWNYSGQNMTTSNVPVFNSICGTPSWGDEDDFMRVRANGGGAVSGGGYANYTDTLNSAACNNGDRFDVISYVHNDAEPQYNSGAGTGIARNVTMTNSTPVNTTGNTFNFSSRISASNATSVTDTARITCNGGPVTLRLVANSAMVSRQLSGTWSPLSDAAATGTIPLSSDPAVAGQIPGCWEFRVLVAYTVLVERPQTPPPVESSATCDMLAIAAAPNRRVSITQLRYSNNNSTFNNVTISWGDGQSATFNSIAEALRATHQYSADGTYTVRATMTFTLNGQTVTRTSAACAQQVTYNSEGGRVTPPPTTTTPTSLPNVGPGSTIAAFSLVTAVGTLGHRFFLGRRLGSQ